MGAVKQAYDAITRAATFIRTRMKKQRIGNLLFTGGSTIVGGPSANPGVGASGVNQKRKLLAAAPNTHCGGICHT